MAVGGVGPWGEGRAYLRAIRKRVSHFGSKGSYEKKNNLKIQGKDDFLDVTRGKASKDGAGRDKGREPAIRNRGGLLLPGPEGGFRDGKKTQS